MDAVPAETKAKSIDAELACLRPSRLKMCALALNVLIIGWAAHQLLLLAEQKCEGTCEL